MSRCSVDPTTVRYDLGIKWEPPKVGNVRADECLVVGFEADYFAFVHVCQRLGATGPETGDIDPMNWPFVNYFHFTYVGTYLSAIAGRPITVLSVPVLPRPPDWSTPNRRIFICSTVLPLKGAIAPEDIQKHAQAWELPSLTRIKHILNSSDKDTAVHVLNF